MNLIGIAIELRPDYRSDKIILKIDKEVVEVEKETGKLFKVKRSGLIFNGLSNIPKDQLGVIHKKDYIDIIERKLWVEELNFNEEQVIEVLKLSVSAELRDRENFINESIKLVR